MKHATEIHREVAMTMFKKGVKSGPTKYIVQHPNSVVMTQATQTAVDSAKKDAAGGKATVKQKLEAEQGVSDSKEKKYR